jgi:DNA-binding response OmpR family regulator
MDISESESLKCAVVVPDEEDLVRKEISALLQKAGFEILATPNGAEALDLCRDRNHSVDLVVIDTAVVKTNPSEIAECVQEIAPRVLFLSDNEEEKLPNLTRGHIYQVLAKPFRRAQLLGRVLEIMDQPLVQSA